ncbi:olfactory protein-like [Phyllobates terribilis]|uniref:olfactory protein-like n=1 Tax=Phyllobates terribilis TaxID=111132 RepID=UPI003CCB548D
MWLLLPPGLWRLLEAARLPAWRQCRVSRTSHQSIITTAIMLQVTAAIVLLLCIQCQAVDIKEQENFDENKFMGKWFGIIAVSNCPVFNLMKKDMTMPIIGFEKDGNTMKSSVAFKTAQGCQQMDSTMEIVDSGHYKHTSVHGDNEVMILKTDYTSYAMEYTKTIHDGHQCITLKLYGRTTELPEIIKKTFMTGIHTMGLTDEDAVVLPGGADCELKGY